MNELFDYRVFISFTTSAERSMWENAPEQIVRAHSTADARRKALLAFLITHEDADVLDVRLTANIVY